MTTPADYLTVTQTARELNLHRRAVIHRIAAGTLAATKVGEARTNAYIIERAEVERIKATDLDAWVDSLPDG